MQSCTQIHSTLAWTTHLHFGFDLPSDFREQAGWKCEEWPIGSLWLFTADGICDQIFRILVNISEEMCLKLLAKYQLISSLVLEMRIPLLKQSYLSWWKQFSEQTFFPFLPESWTQNLALICAMVSFSKYVQLWQALAQEN